MSTNLQFHNATQETFDAFPGEVKTYSSFWTRAFDLRATDGEELTITIFCGMPETTESVAEPAADEIKMTPSLQSAIQKRLDERAAERKAAAIEQARLDRDRCEREEQGKAFFIAELEKREGIRLDDAQVEIAEEKNRTVYSISVFLSKPETRQGFPKTITVLFAGNMYYNKEKEFGFSSWDSGHGNWYVFDKYFPTLADAAIAALDLKDPEIELTDDDLPF